MERSRLKDAAKVSARAALARLDNGRHKDWLSIDGYMALMADKIERWFERRDGDELLEFAVDGLFMVAKILTDHGVQPTEQPYEYQGYDDMTDIDEEALQEKLRQARELFDGEEEPVEADGRGEVQEVPKPRRRSRPVKREPERKRDDSGPEPGGE